MGGRAALALLLKRIWQKANELLGIEPAAFMDWLERTAPAVVSADAGTGATSGLARLADVMDELDGVLATALAELERIGEAPMTRARVEEELKSLWARTFTIVAAEQEAWLEAAFIRRGGGILDHLYPDAEERRRLYQYGFPPVIGRRFEVIAGQIREILAGATEYGEMTPAARIDIFEAIGSLLEADKGFGFRVRSTVSDQAIF